jgi:hypothetical protein
MSLSAQSPAQSVVFSIFWNFVFEPPSPCFHFKFGLRSLLGRCSLMWITDSSYSGHIALSITQQPYICHLSDSLLCQSKALSQRRGMSPLHSLVPEQVWTFLHSENKQTEHSCYYLYGEQKTGIEKRPKVVALFGPRIRQKYHYVIKASLQNVPHSVSANSCRVSRTLKPMWSAPVEEPMGFKYEFINAGV